jgi:cobalamin biosynthesis protein CobC
MDKRKAGSDPLPRHGGDLALATAVYGTPREGWLDLSTGINPHPYPAGVVDLSLLHRLPPSVALDHLEAAARSAYGAPTSVSLIATPGTEIAIRSMAFVAPPGPVAIVSPTYRSHGEAWGNVGRTVVTVAAPDGVPPGTAIAVVANPNNPDGRVTDPSALAALAGRVDLLVVDEAFADLTPHASLVPRLDGLNAVVLRSFGKFFGLPGLRLGFAMGHSRIVARLAALLGDWPVSGPAIAIGTTALSDNAWQAAMRAQLAAGAARLCAVLAEHGHAIRGATNLFALIEHTDAAMLHQRLARQGIWTRAFEEQPTWLRIGLPATDADFVRLEAAFSAR